MFAAGDTLYSTSYEWDTSTSVNGTERWTVRYYLNKVDLAHRAAPKIGARYHENRKLNAPAATVTTTASGISFATVQRARPNPCVHV